MRDDDAIQQLKRAADRAWAEAAKHMKEYHRQTRNANLAKSQGGHETFLKMARQASDAADRWLKPFRKLVRAIEAREKE